MPLLLLLLLLERARTRSPTVSARAWSTTRVGSWPRDPPDTWTHISEKRARHGRTLAPQGRGERSERGEGVRGSERACSPHGRPPMSRLWASTAAEPRRIFTARRLEMWPRRFAWLHLDFSCRCAAQFHSKEFAVGAMPPMRAVVRSRAEPTAVLICMVQAWWKPSPRPACELS